MHSLKIFLLSLVFVLAMGSPMQAGAQTKVQAASVVTVPQVTPLEIKSELVAVPPTQLQGIFATPPTLTLIPHSPQAHPGDIWLRSTDDGLHIWGRVQADEAALHWPQQKSEMLASDHIEIWLAASPDVPMPTIGWGNQFGATELRDREACMSDDNFRSHSEEGRKNCAPWYDEQVQYRRDLQRLFARQWLITGSGQGYPQHGHFFEDYASTAYAGLSANFFPEFLPSLLQPKSDDGLVVDIGSEGRLDTIHRAGGSSFQGFHQTGYTFHIFIPYTAFPPAQQLKLSDFYLMVDVFGSAAEGHKMGEYSTTSATRQWGKSATFNHIRLASPRTFSISPCENKPVQTDLYGDEHLSWFLPTKPGKDATLHSTFALVNPAGGYMYEAAGVSPEASQAKYFWKELANGATVCGPKLAWHKGNISTHSEFSVNEKYFEARILPDGWTLIRSGPDTSTLSPFGSGQCGSCPVVGFNLYAVSPKGEVTSALKIEEDLSGQGGSPNGADLAIDPDWKRITLYRTFEDYAANDPKPRSTSTTYCLEGHGYKKCVESEHAKPPEPANFPDLGSPD
jgi:hypothetical protein